MPSTTRASGAAPEFHAGRRFAAAALCLTALGACTGGDAQHLPNGNFLVYGPPPGR